MNKNVNKISKIALALVLSTTMFVTACSVSQFEAVLNQIQPALATIIEIVALFKNVAPNLAPAQKAGADVAALEKLYNDYQSTSSASGKTGVQAAINSGFAVLNSDIQTVFATAQVSDPNTQNKILAFIGLINTGVTIAESTISGSPKAGPTAANMNADTLVNSWNNILVAKTGVPAVDAYTPKHKLHIHSGTARFFSFGIAR